MRDRLETTRYIAKDNSGNNYILISKHLTSTTHDGTSRSTTICLEDGTPVERNSDTTFKISTTGVIIYLVDNLWKGVHING